MPEEPRQADVERNLAVIRERIADAAAVGGREAADVTIVAATKYVAPGGIAPLVAAGVTDLGENRLDSLADKQAGDLAGEVRWHYIGRLQSRKAGEIAARVDTIHTLSSTSAAERLAAHVGQGGRLPRLLVQVNSAGDPAKDGLEPDDVDRFLTDLPTQLQIDGFMTMPAFAEDPELSRPAFDALRQLQERLRAAHTGRHPLRSLSMGTTQDYEVAVEEGATHVRLGRILYALQEYVPHDART